MRPYSFSNLILLSFTYLLSSACCESDLRKFRDFIKDISNLKLTAKMTINKEIVLKNKNLPNLNCNTSHENHSRKPNKTHVKLNTMNLSFHNNPKSRCGSSMDQNNECTLLETPSVKNVLSNENFNYDRNNNHDRCAFPPPFFDSMFSTKETIFNTSFTQPQSPVDFNKDLARASMKNKCNLSLFDVPLKNTPVKAKTNSIRIKKINTQSMEKEQRRNISEIPTVQEPQELRKSLNLPQTNCNFLEVPVYYCNLKSEIKKLKKENWKLKQENTDLTRKLAKFDEIQSKCNRLELNQKTDFESLVKDLSQKCFKLEEYSNSLKLKLFEAQNQFKIEESKWMNRLDEQKTHIEILKSSIKKLVVVNKETKETLSKQFMASQSKMIDSELNSGPKPMKSEICNKREVIKRIYSRMTKV